MALSEEDAHVLAIRAIAWRQAVMDAITKKEKIARAACDPRATAEGEHWRWEYTFWDHPRVDEPVPMMAADQWIGNGDEVGLRSKEQYPMGPYTPQGLVPHIVIQGVQEVEFGVAQHIVTHDPAAVLTRCTLDRQVVSRHWPDGEQCSYCRWAWPCADFEDIAKAYEVSLK